ncbi:MAG: Uma2 family endonuclease [Spirosomataceae bacterium]
MGGIDSKRKNSFPYLIPDFVVKLESETDHIHELKNKIEKWIVNGVRLGWLVSSREQQTYVYRPITLLK